MKTMSYAIQNKAKNAAELRRFRICVAFGVAVLYLFLVLNAKTQDTSFRAIGLHGTAAQLVR